MGFPVVPDDECSSTTSSSGTANRPYGKVSRSTDLVRERQHAHVLERLDVGGGHARIVHACTVPGHALVRPANLRDELLQLDGVDALARGAFDSRIVDGQA